MYEEIRKPKMLKDVPTSLIRALPTIYYTNKFSGPELTDRVRDLYTSNVLFLNQALKKIGHQLNNDDFTSLAENVLKLQNTPSIELLDQTQKVSVKLGELCSMNRETLRKNNNRIKAELTMLYSNLVNTINVLLIDNSRGERDINKIAGTLKNLCSYHTDQTEPVAYDFTPKLLASDFALFYCISSPDIHKQVNSLTTYHKPGMAMMHIDKDVAINQEAIRHGAQLMKIGFCVLYKMFTPIRLFTTIDKTYLHYNLQLKH